MLTSKKWPKSIVFSTRFGPNFLWHILATARIGYDSEYADQYRDTIQEDDLEYLKSVRSWLAFAEGESGELVVFFNIIPSFLRIDEEIQFRKYFDSLKIAFDKKSLKPIVDAFPSANWDDKFFREFLQRAKIPERSNSLMDILGRFTDIYLRSLRPYRDIVWDGAQANMKKRRDELDDFFSREDYIAKWERFLKIPFVSNEYEFILCYSNKNGPDFNSIGYCGNLFYYDKPFSRTCQFLSHEIGTHLLIDVYLSLAQTNKYNHRQLYSAYETLAMFYNKLILGVEKLDYSLSNMEDIRHLEIYKSHYNKSTPPVELLLKGLD